MEDYQETRLHEPAPRAGELKALKRRRLMGWVLYAVAAGAILAAVLSGAWWFY